MSQILGASGPASEVDCVVVEALNNFMDGFVSFVCFVGDFVSFDC